MTTVDPTGYVSGDNDFESQHGSPLSIRKSSVVSTYDGWMFLGIIPAFCST